MIFLDTSFLVSLEVETDTNHEKAAAVMEKIIKGDFGDSIISDYIFDETMTVTFGRIKNLEKTVKIGVNLRRSSKMMKISGDTLKVSWKIFKNQKGTKLSFTDCTVIALMKSRGIKNLATFDEDFKKVGGINIYGL